MNICQKDLLIGPSGLTPVALQRASRKAYTLLEVVLALALTVLVLGGISMAINFHLITLRDQQAEIERSQIARQSLFMITKDIRSAIQYKPIESSALDELIESVESATAMARTTSNSVYAFRDARCNATGVSPEGPINKSF